MRGVVDQHATLVAVLIALDGRSGDGPLQINRLVVSALGTCTISQAKRRLRVNRVETVEWGDLARLTSMRTHS